MGKRILSVDWSSLGGAAAKRRRLNLKADNAGIFHCPVSTCLHGGFKTNRGLTKHLNNKHEWYFYHDTQPTFHRSDVKVIERKKIKASTHQIPAFSIEKGCGRELVLWLQTIWGGSRSHKDAKQVASRCMKFLMSSLDGEIESIAYEEYVDCCLGSPSILMKFIQLIIDEWGLKSSGVLSYLRAISDLCDFRKARGVSDAVLRLFAVTEVYLRKSKVTMQRKRQMEYTRNYDLESLIARDSWCSLQEVQKTIPFHSPKYLELIKKARTGKEPLSISEVVFCTRFVVTFIFLHVKCTRPQSIQFLLCAHIKKAHETGFVDQTQFKTHNQYTFDSLTFTPAALAVVDSYINHIRPLCSPKKDCDYVLLSSKGTQLTNVGECMSLTCQLAIGKFINPTRYRQIIETESDDKLDSKQQAALTLDQRHSSNVAKRYYVKKSSRQTSLAGAECMSVLAGPGRNEHTDELANQLNTAECIANTCTLNSSQDVNVESNVVNTPNTDTDVTVQSTNVTTTTVECMEMTVQVGSNLNADLESNVADTCNGDEDVPVKSTPASTDVITPSTHVTDTCNGDEDVPVKSAPASTDVITPSTHVTSNVDIAEIVAAAEKEINGNLQSTALIDAGQSSSSDLEIKPDYEEELFKQLKEPSIIIEPILLDELSTTTNVRNNVPNSLIVQNDLAVKKEELEVKRFAFTEAEDGYIKQGLKKYGNTKNRWHNIVSNPDFKFHECRTRYTIRSRAVTLNLVKTKGRKAATESNAEINSIKKPSVI